MSRSSLRFRLAAVVVALVAATVAALAVALYQVVARAAWRQHDRALANRARAMTALAEHDDDDGYEFERPADSPAGRTGYYQLWLPDGETLARSPSLGDGDLPKVGGSLSAPFHDDLTLPDGRPGRLVGLRFLPRDEGEGRAGELTLVLAEDTEDVRATLATVRRRFWLVGAPAVLAAALLAVWLLARGLRPLQRLAADLERIDDRRLSVRLPVAGQPDELQAPVRKLNELLARLDASFARERQFTADVSHELRTPLAGLRTLLDVTLLRERGGEEYRAALVDARDITIQLAALVENLLALARLEGGQTEIVVEELELRALVEESWRPHAARAAERGLELRNEVSPGVVVRSDRVKLRLVLSNLLANAVEYTDPRGWIAVSAGHPSAGHPSAGHSAAGHPSARHSAAGHPSAGQASGGWVDGALPDAFILDVVDSGPAIPEEQIERIFDRLWRGDPSRSAGAHFGIGLSLVRSVCRHLGMSVDAANLPDGSVRFRVSSC